MRLWNGLETRHNIGLSTFAFWAAIVFAGLSFVALFCQYGGPFLAALFLLWFVIVMDFLWFAELNW